MQVPTIKLSEVSKNSAKIIINASKQKTTLGTQVHLADYYAFLHFPQNAASDVKNFAKNLIIK